MRGRGAILVLFSLSALVAPGLTADSAPARAADPLAVIVHPSNKVSTLAARELQTLFLRRRSSWPDGGTVLLLNWPPHSAARLRFDSVVLKMSADEVSAYWIDMRIRGQGHPPRSIGSATILASIVARNREAIAYLPLTLVTRHVKVLRIDGLTPDNPRYLLRRLEVRP